MAKVFGGIDGGGTKFLCVIGTSPENILESETIATSEDPRDTLSKVARFFLEHQKTYDIASIGLAIFGPMDLTPRSPTWGHILKTTKPGWNGARPIEELRRVLGDIPIGIATDVGGAALAEAEWGAGADAHSMTYITIGTGVGGAHVLDGRLLNGFTHSELGHMTLRRHPDDDYGGFCEYHVDCAEGLISGPAIQDCAQADSADLNHTDPVFDYVAYYLGQLCANIFFCNAPERIVLGGGVMQKAGLIEKVRTQADDFIAGYLSWPRPENMAEAIVLSKWVDVASPGATRPVPSRINAGALGGLLIAREAARGQH